MLATKKCKLCQSEIDAKAKRCPQCQGDLRIWPARHKILTGLGGFIIFIFLITFIVGIIAGIASTFSRPNQPAVSTQAKQAVSAPKPAPPKPKPAPRTRQVTGTATTLGAGTFTGGKDVASGLYDVTGANGESGNFVVEGNDSYNEVLGQTSDMGVPKVRVKISDGDKIEISGLSQVTFTPVTTPFVTTQTTTTLYAGTFVVGEDIAAGRYVATPGSGESGNFIVEGNDSYDEVLGQTSGMGVPNLTVNLSDSDTITISGLSQVTMTPSS